jgi:hypothetical protein
VTGTIGVLSGDRTTYRDFAVSVIHHQSPPGTKLIWTQGADIVGNMNAIVRGMVGEWLWLLGDDHTFDFDLLQRLLEHDVDVVVPVCLKRSPPYAPVVYSHQNEDGEYVTFLRLPRRGLVEIHAAGSAGMLIRRPVLDAIGDPWFETHGGLNEDLSFCAKVREAGLRLWCDTESSMGHIGQVEVWPEWREGEWMIQLRLGNGVTMPVRRFPESEPAEMVA